MREIATVVTERTKRRLLVGCLSTLIGGPLMCGCLLALNFVLFPALDSVDAENFPALLVVGGILFFLALAALTAAALVFYLRRRNFPIPGATHETEVPSEESSRFRQAAFLALVVGMPLCFIAIGVIAYLLVSFD